ncbi:hypothetical protein TWF506_002502 [Arthrobotrys conoides]|uniref:Uncharacterized protein n=1 Tax=Arthrobotrys conoides TaxID=74498 RepID=A0AAN8ND49_9PEZI
MKLSGEITATSAGVLTNTDGLIILTRPETAKEDPITVKIPDLFISIVGEPKTLNQFLEKAISTDDWACKVLDFDEKLTKEGVDMRFPLPCASMVPNSTEQPLQAFTEWVSWSIPFDDRIDGGYLANDLGGAAKENIESLAIMDDDYPTVDPEEKGFDVEGVGVGGWTGATYMLGLLQQIKWLGYKDRVLTVDEYLAFRHPSSGMGPTCVFAEWSITEANKIPYEVVEHPSVEIFRDLFIDIVSIQAYSLQGAIDEAGKMVLDRYKIWEQAVRDLPSWGEEIDAVVLKLVRAYSDVCWENMNWSYFLSH